MVVDVEYVLAFPSAVSFLMLAFLTVFVLRSGFHHIENVVFAALAALNALQAVSESTTLLISDPVWYEFFDRLYVWTSLVLPLVVLYFAFIFPFRSPGFAKRGWIAPLVFAGVAVLILYLYESAPRTLHHLYAIEIGGRTGYVSVPFGYFGIAYPILIGFTAFGVLRYKQRHPRTEIEADRAKHVLTAFGVLIFSLLAVLPLPFVPLMGIDAGSSALLAFVTKATLSITTVLFAILIAFAILRYQVFNVEFIIRKGLSYTLTLVSLALTWVVMGELLEVVVGNFLESTTNLRLSNTVVSIISALIVFPLISPVEKVSSKMLTRLLPKLKEAKEEADVSSRAEQIYRAALEDAWADGAIHGRELSVLATLRRSLGVSDDAHLRMEIEVHRQLGISPPAGTATA